MGGGGQNGGRGRETGLDPKAVVVRVWWVPKRGMEEGQTGGE
jgi:hypothetical protein